jgi:apolipoprotein N-acyltransferase
VLVSGKHLIERECGRLWPRLRVWELWLPPVLTGALIAATFLDFSLYPLAWVAFVPLLWTLAGVHTQRQALLVGALAGLATNIPAFHWLAYTMHIFGGFPYALALFFYTCLSAYSAAQFVLFALGMRLLGAGPLALAAPVLWVALEFLYPNLFPWRMAHTQFHVLPLIQIGDLTGPVGLSFVIVWFSAGVAALLREPRRWSPIAAGLLAAGAVTAYGVMRMSTVGAAVAAAPVVRVGLVQGNLSIVEKGSAAYFDVNLDKYRRLSEPLQSTSDVLIWPETVVESWVQVGVTHLPPEFNPFPQLHRFLVYGGLAFEEETPNSFTKFNSAFLLAPGGEILGRYDKLILLPFGEYLPGASLIPGLAKLSPQTGDFTPGRRIVTLDVPGLVRIAPLICYEDVPPGIARAMTQHGAEALLTLFNDAWFGRSAAPYQHEALALWRAVENRRYFLRAGNAGVTGVIDPFGRSLGRLGLFTEDVLEAEIRPLRMRTFYTRYGDVFGWAVVLVAGVWVGAAWSRSRLRGREERRGLKPPAE